MKLNNIISTLAMVGALGSSSAAFADQWQGHHHRDDQRKSDRFDDRPRLDVINSATLEAGRGEVSFGVTPGMRRDGLQLVTDAGHLRLLSVDFVYSDGRVVRERVRRAMKDGRLLTIQTGRPPGLRTIRVRYALGSADTTYSANLALVQVHTGDGYTHEADLWKYHADEGWFPNDDDR